MIKATTKEIRKGGVNLSKIWFALHALRAEIAQFVSPAATTNAEAAGEKALTFPDPCLHLHPQRQLVACVVFESLRIQSMSSSPRR
jgi:predicted ATP-dependent endonuclease of OLD family